jgi:hypothetical protein
LFVSTSSVARLIDYLLAPRFDDRRQFLGTITRCDAAREQVIDEAGELRTTGEFQRAAASSSTPASSKPPPSHTDSAPPDIAEQVGPDQASTVGPIRVDIPTKPESGPSFPRADTTSSKPATPIATASRSFLMSTSSILNRDLLHRRPDQES